MATRKPRRISQDPLRPGKALQEAFERGGREERKRIIAELRRRILSEQIQRHDMTERRVFRVVLDWVLQLEREEL